MSLCRYGLCKVEVGDNGYCGPHGGRERLECEWVAKAEREAERQTQMNQPKPGATKPRFAERPRGQAVPVRQGLARFSASKRGENRRKRAEKEAKREAERKARGPKKKKGDKKDKKKKRGKQDKKAARKAAGC